ncbi:hypothetical protein EBT31_06255 [bacterium]|nr:hypothetical protein [bacterium]
MLMAALSKNSLRPALWWFLTLFSHMQLVEYFLWTYLKVPSLNRFWSIIGLLVILAEPIASLNILPDKRIALVYTLGTLVWLFASKINFSTEVGANGHLKWNWVMDSWSIWMYLWLAALLAPLFISKNYVLFGWGLLSLAISFYFNNKFGTVGSYWCWLSIFGWLLVVLKLT